MSQELMKPVTDSELTMHLENLGLLKDLTPGEKNSYLQIAKAFNLNPFKREIHVSKYNGQMSIITGYEVYIKRAERTGQLDGWNVTTDGKAEDGSLKAILTIYRKDRSHPFVWEAEYSEYVQMVSDKNTGKLRPNKFWQKAKTMIKKVAISQGFRLCFSDELGGMPYTADEVQEQVTEEINHEVVYKDPTKVIADADEDYTFILSICSTLEDLKTEWLKIPKDQRPKYQTLKDAIKTQIENATKQPA